MMPGVTDLLSHLSSSSSSPPAERSPSLTTLLLLCVPKVLGPASDIVMSLMPRADSLRSPKLLLDDLNVLPPVCALTRDMRMPDRCRRGVGGGGIGRAADDGPDVGPAEAPGGGVEEEPCGDSCIGEMGVEC